MNAPVGAEFKVFCRGLRPDITSGLRELGMDSARELSGNKAVDRDYTAGELPSFDYNGSHLVVEARKARIAKSNVLVRNSSNGREFFFPADIVIMSPRTTILAVAEPWDVVISPKVRTPLINLHTKSYQDKQKIKSLFLEMASEKSVWTASEINAKMGTNLPLGNLRLKFAFAITDTGKRMSWHKDVATILDRGLVKKTAM